MLSNFIQSMPYFIKNKTPFFKTGTLFFKIIYARISLWN
ncbi:hypothetical protein NC99_04990 [Sunxiuqinia dokdonensis]|uniref:Uncharacterized protein n=1 Tax=Sunxiuqinia dokdonensis TaxID=1409788 RepID=A0A0L8VDY4_9BACT|nr:hypothetical protein NC99_04990 [Sunxiuqinia dokdonensis]